MKRSLFTGVEPFLPLPVLGICTTHTTLSATVDASKHASQPQRL